MSTEPCHLLVAGAVNAGGVKEEAANSLFLQALLFTRQLCWGKGAD